MSSTVPITYVMKCSQIHPQMKVPSRCQSHIGWKAFGTLWVRCALFWTPFGNESRIFHFPRKTVPNYLSPISTIVIRIIILDHKPT